MRIVSLLPSTTEIVCALGRGEALVGVTHECDHPAEVVADLPRVTRSPLDPHAMSQAAIDAAVSASVRSEHSLYTLDEPLLASLAPTHVLTQSLCDVCAVGHDTVLATCARLLGDDPRLISLEPGTLAEVLQTVRVVGRELDAVEAAEAVIARAEARLAEVRAAVGGRPRPRVAFLEWMDPLWSGGHWVPEQIDAAGGLDVVARPGAPSGRLDPDTVAEARPDVLVLGPCGFGLDRVLADAPALLEAPWVRALQPARIVAVDADRFFARPGPRLVEGAAALAEALHGVDLGAPDGAWAPVEVPWA